MYQHFCLSVESSFATVGIDKAYQFIYRIDRRRNFYFQFGSIGGFREDVMPVGIFHYERSHAGHCNLERSCPAGTYMSAAGNNRAARCRIVQGEPPAYGTCVGICNRQIISSATQTALVFGGSIHPYSRPPVNIRGRSTSNGYVDCPVISPVTGIPGYVRRQFK